MENEIDDEVQPGYAEAPQFEQSNAPIAGRIDEEGHIQPTELWGVQKRTFMMQTTSGATLEKLAASAKNGLLWSMPAEQKNYLKQVNKTNNRSEVSDKDLDGDLTKALFLSARIVGFWNDSPKDIALDIGGLVPTVHTDTGRHTYVIKPTGGNYTVLNKSIMEPENVFTKFMYAHNQKCNLKTLGQQIRLDHDKEKQIALMDSRGVGWKVLTDNLKSEDSPFIGALDAIYSKNRHIFEDPDPEHSQLAVVPYQIAEQVYNAIAAPLKTIEKSYIDFSNWRVKFSPADKQSWNSISGLAKDAVIYGVDAVDIEVSNKLNTPFNAGVEVELEYVLDN
jgi:hypothetical protein